MTNTKSVPVLLMCGVLAGTAQQNPAERLIEAGHWKRARSLVETQIKQSPDDPLTNFQLSQIRAAFGDRTTPLQLAEKAVALDGRSAKYHRQVAEVLGVMAQHSGAIQQLMLARRFRKEIDLALALDPRDTQALRDLLEFYLLAPGIVGGDREKADSVADRILAVHQAEGWLAKARIAEFRKQTGETETSLRKAAASPPSSYRARVALARFYLAAEHPNLEAAEEHAREALRLDPGRVDSYAILAELHAANGRWDQLDAILAASAQAVSDDLVPCYRAAEQLLASGKDLARAEKYLRSYLGQPPEGNQPPWSQAFWKLGLVLEKQGRTADAIHAWQESVRLDPESPASRELKRARKGANR